MKINGVHIEGLEELVEMLDTMEKIPQKCVNTSARKGAMIIQKAVKPKLSTFLHSASNEHGNRSKGNLKRGIVRKKEKAKRNQSKGVYDVVFDPSMTDVFRKDVKNKGKFGGKNPTAYYPASLEYGWKTGTGGSSGGHVEGYRFLKDTANEKEHEVLTEMTKVLAEEIDKIPTEGRTRLEG